MASRPGLAPAERAALAVDNARLYRQMVQIAAQRAAILEQIELLGINALGILLFQAGRVQGRGHA